LSRCSFHLSHPATTEIYTLSLHDALPISLVVLRPHARREAERGVVHPGERLLVRRDGLDGEDRAERLFSHQPRRLRDVAEERGRSEEHTSELQSRENLVCRLLLEKKKEKE